MYVYLQCMRTCACMYRDFMQTIHLNVCCLLSTARHLESPSKTPPPPSPPLLPIYFVCTTWRSELNADGRIFSSFVFFFVFAFQCRPSQVNAIYVKLYTRTPRVYANDDGNRHESSEIPKFCMCARALRRRHQHHNNNMIWRSISVSRPCEQQQAQLEWIWKNTVHRARFTLHVQNK